MKKEKKAYQYFDIDFVELRFLVHHSSFLFLFSSITSPVSTITLNPHAP